jgi:hypothetical protein
MSGSETGSYTPASDALGEEARPASTPRKRPPSRSFGGYAHLLGVEGAVVGGGPRDERPRCSCGFLLSELDAVRKRLALKGWHDRYQNGVVLPESFPFEDVCDGILKVPTGADGPAAKAANIAEAARRAATEGSASGPASASRRPGPRTSTSKGTGSLATCAPRSRCGGPGRCPEAPAKSRAMRAGPWWAWPSWQSAGVGGI